LVPPLLSGIPSSAGERYRFSSAFTGFTTEMKTAAAMAMTG
jgi:hypothetical protein